MVAALWAAVVQSWMAWSRDVLGYLAAELPFYTACSRGSRNRASYAEIAMQGMFQVLEYVWDDSFPLPDSSVRLVAQQAPEREWHPMVVKFMRVAR